MSGDATTTNMSNGERESSLKCSPRPNARTRARPGLRSAVGVELVGGDLLADLLERPADQPRDVHLRDAHLLRDLRLRQPFEEAQVQDLPLAVVEHLEPGREHRP